ncbi:MAG: CTP synthase, partial [Treponema sp.]|nr:CTP synthase [Treponema sp.]
INDQVVEENCCYIHLTLVPFIKKAREIKTKHTQHSVKELQALGIQPNILMLRTEIPLDETTRERLAQFCNVDTDSVIQNMSARSIYEVPLNLEKEGLGNAVCKALHIEGTQSHLEEWARMVSIFENPRHSVRIALVGKYVELHDAYLSVVESLIHGGIANESSVDIDWVDSETLTDDGAAEERLKDADGIIVPGGFGSRGTEGMILAAKYARTHNVPYFGICLGMQILVIEYARNVLGWSDANSFEIDSETVHAVIDLMPDQKGKERGGTLRRGKFECVVKPGTLTHKAYGSLTVWERHRHRYEFNNAFRADLEKAGLIIAGVNPERDLVEIVEVPGHPWMLGGQFHPEFKSRPNKAGPLFRDFIAASLLNRKSAGR